MGQSACVFLLQHLCLCRARDAARRPQLPVIRHLQVTPLQCAGCDGQTRRTLVQAVLTGQYGSNTGGPVWCICLT